MFENLSKPKSSSTVSNSKKTKTDGAPSFKKIRKIKKESRLRNKQKKRLLLMTLKEGGGQGQQNYSGPTPETQSKLKPDPLVVFQRKNILNEQQIWAFRRIRQAVQMITDGCRVRLSSFSTVVVQTSRVTYDHESDHEIRAKELYCRWVDRMTEERIQVGPILDIIIDELSLNAVDRKWGRRKGWAKIQLQAALNLYGASSSSDNRYK